jgi:hypothetical protein
MKLTPDQVLAAICVLYAVIGVFSITLLLQIYLPVLRERRIERTRRRIHAERMRNGLTIERTRKAS